MVKIEIPDRDLVAGLEKGLAVIEAFDAAHTKLTVVDVAKMTGLTRAAARRYLLTLVKNGYADTTANSSAFCRVSLDWDTLTCRPPL